MTPLSIQTKSLERVCDCLQACNLIHTFQQLIPSDKQIMTNFVGKNADFVTVYLLIPPVFCDTITYVLCDECA